MDSIRFAAEINSPKELVWLAWTKADRITQWFAPAANIEAHVGGAFELFFIPSDLEHMNTKGCKFTSLEANQHLGFTWKGPDDFAGIMNKEESLTRVFVTFTDNNSNTNVVIEHSGWGDGEEWEKACAWHEMAWNQVLESLKSAMESGKGNLCCK